MNSYISYIKVILPFVIPWCYSSINYNPKCKKVKTDQYLNTVSNNSQSTSMQKKIELCQ